LSKSPGAKDNTVFTQTSNSPEYKMITPFKIFNFLEKHMSIQIAFNFMSDYKVPPDLSDDR
jgi:hypothetical protein